MKRTHYQYRAQKPPQGEKERIYKEETTAEWKLRLKGLGMSTVQVNAIEKVTSLEAFINYCRDNSLDICDIEKSRLISNRT